MSKIKLRTAQKLFLKEVEKTRNKGNNKGIMIFASGLGKTLSSLSDALRVSGKNGKILVLAHNHNLLYQHAKDFKLLNQDKKIGFLYGSKKELDAEVLFANIMTLKKKKYLHSFKKDEFDYIIVDETHRAGAKSYKCIFEYFKPKFLLGMSATPTRTDQIDIFPFYDNNIIVDIDVYTAINNGWLRPYNHVFLWDKFCNYKDLKSYRQKNGFHKYNVRELGKKYAIPERDEAIIKEFKKRAGNRKGIGFCVSVKECIRMARLFNENGIKSIAVWGGYRNTREMKVKERNEILKDFENGKYQIIFNCELLGEGFHIPLVDVVLKLSPTYSYIKDTQQNGRGLYNIEGLKRKGKKVKKLLILDWVGNYNQSYMNYLFQGVRKNINSEFKDIRELVEIPIGCKVEFEGRVIKEFNEQYAQDIKNRRMGLKEAVEEFKKIFGNKKPYRQELNKKSRSIYHQFDKNNLLDKYCKPKKYKSLNDAIREYKKIYGKNKPYKQQLRNESYSIYLHLWKKGLLDKYCKPRIQKNLNDAIREYKKIYGKNKPLRKELREENHFIYKNFEDNDLLNKYCQDQKERNLDNAIREYKKIYKNKKPLKSELEKENRRIYQQFLNYKLVNKYCESEKERNLNNAIRDFKRIYKNKKPYRQELNKKNHSIYYQFRINNLLNKYCKKSRRNYTPEKEVKG